MGRSTTLLGIAIMRIERPEVARDEEQVARRHHRELAMEIGDGCYAHRRNLLARSTGV